MSTDTSPLVAPISCGTARYEPGFLYLNMLGGPPTVVPLSAISGFTFVPVRTSCLWTTGGTGTVFCPAPGAGDVRCTAR